MSDGIFFYANEGSRRASAEFDGAVEALGLAGIRFDESRLCEDHDELDRIVRRRVEEGAKVVFVGGGDGTLGSVSSYFMDSETVFGAFPLGTGNQFAREVTIPSDIQEAAACLAQGRVAKIDLGTCNGKGFLTVATLGLTTEIARSLTAKQTLGKASYGPAVIKAIQNMKPFRVEIVGQSETIDGEMIQVVVCNGRTHAGPFQASEDATITDGMFDIYAVEPMDIGHMVGASILALVGQHTGTDEIDWMKTDHAVIRSEPRQPVILDGEELWFDELIFEMKPAAIHALVGPDLRVPQGRLSKLQFS